MNINLLKNNYIVFISFTLSLIFFTSCNLDCISIEGEGPIIERRIDTESFNAIENSIPATVVVNQGESLLISAKGQSNILDLIKLEVMNNKLRIGFEKNCVNTNYDSLIIQVTLPNLKALEVNGSGQVVVEDVFQCDNLELSISGSGEIKASVKASNSLEASISGSGSLDLFGNAPQTSFDISGSGEIHAFNFQAKKSTISVSGSGDAELYVIESLDASVSGSGDIQYKGSPQISTSISGSGELRAVK